MEGTNHVLVQDDFRSVEKLNVVAKWGTRAVSDLGEVDKA